MADDSNLENGLPPKLDLRKKVITPLSARSEAPAPAAGVAATPASPAPVQGTAISDSDATRGTIRITLPDMPQAASAKPVLPTFSKQEGESQPLDQTATEPGQGEPAPATGASGPRPLMRPVLTPKTIKLKKPIPLGIKRDTPDPAAPAGSKRSTSKISLPSDQDTSNTATPGMPQPIRMAQTTPSTTANAETGSGDSDNVDMPAPVPPVVPPQPAPDPKRQTSRISLESVLGSEGESGPKTIKLKRPGSTIRVQGMESPAATDARRQSSAVELPTDTANDDAPETQKKTIKVKRPSARPSLRTGGSGGADGSTTGAGSSPTMFTPPSKALAAADSAHWFFILTGCAATIIIGVLVYVLCAQVLGPNISLTELAYWAPDAELPWPGRITR